MWIFFYYLMSVWGATHILVSSKITERLRNWLLINVPMIGYLFDCYQCTSFWVSIVFYYLFDFNLPIKIINLHLIHIDPSFLVMGFVGSGIVSFISVFLSIMITRSKK